MYLKSEEITDIIKKRVANFKNKLEVSEVGTVIQVGDGIALIYGLDNVMVGEVVAFENGVQGLVLNLEENNVGVIILGEYTSIKEGSSVKRTKEILSIHGGEGILGRVVNALGEPLDDKGSIKSTRLYPLEKKAPDIIERDFVNTPLETGIKAIDALVPIGRGQRELITGDRHTGKTSLAVDSIIHQKGKDVYCIYVAIGQKASSVATLIKELTEKGSMEYTTIVVATASDPAPMLYIAPYAGCAIAESLMEQGKDVLIVYDDLTKHAASYREISLLLRRPPGREAYPGDVFYLHSRLLERASKVNSENGGGSITALPIVETQAGDISSYIPTNVISITDGQIFLETDLFNEGIRPAINPGISVSRVGGNAQFPALKQVAVSLRINLAQYRELEAFSQFSSDLDEETRQKLVRGEKLIDILRQPNFNPIDVEEQVIIILAANNGLFDHVSVEDMPQVESKLIAFMRTKHNNLFIKIKNREKLSTDDFNCLKQSIQEFRRTYLGIEGDHGSITSD